jgi:hypothetical protein
MGQLYSHFPHMVQIHGHLDSRSGSSRPREMSRIIFLGSNPSIPDTGQELAHRPQVTQ